MPKFAWLSGLGLALLFSPLFLTVDLKSKGAATKEELCSLYRRYAMAKDKERISTLVYWQGVQDRERNAFNKSIEYDSQFKIKKVEITPLDKDQVMEYTIQGITYRPTLKPIGNLVVTYESQGTVNALSTSYLVGSKDARYYITLASPVEE